MRLTRRAAKKEECIAILSGVALFLSVVEYAIPKPFPFFRLGIANLPVMFAVRLLDARSVFLLICVKVLAVSIFQGTLFSYVFLFSAAGSAASGFAMFIADRIFKDRISFTGMGVTGALSSNIVQLILARILVFGESAWLLAPPFLIAGTTTAFALGLIGNIFYARSGFIKLLKKELSLSSK